MPSGALPLAVLGAVAGETAVRAISPQALIDSMQQLIKYTFPTSLPPVDILVTACAGGYISFDDYLKLMRKHGFKEEFSRFIYQILKPRASVTDFIRAVFYDRGHLVDHKTLWNTIKEDLRQRGFDEAEAFYLTTSYMFMPSLSDLLQWMSKEAFEDDIAKDLGLDEELPYKFLEYGKRLGIPEEDLKRYWRAHWGMASWTQVAEAFHRARAEAYKQGTYEAEMQKWKKYWNIFYRQAEIPRFYRDMLTSITYSVITRVDARRMYELGFLSDREFVATLIAQGYTKEDAERMLAWVKWETQRYGEEDLRGMTRAHVESLYELGLIDDKEFVSLMKKVGVGEETAEYLLAIKKQKIYQKEIKTKMNQIKTLLKKGKISEDEARQELIRLGVEHELASMYVEEWSVEKTEEEKELTKEDIKQAVRQGIFDLSKAYQKLRQIGYSEDDAITLLRIWGASVEQIRGLMAELKFGGGRR